MDELLEDFLRDLWRREAGHLVSPAPFLRICREWAKEGDFAELLREQYRDELAALAEVQDDLDEEGVRADMAYDRAVERRLGVD